MRCGQIKPAPQINRRSRMKSNENESTWADNKRSDEADEAGCNESTNKKRQQQEATKPKQSYDKGNGRMRQEGANPGGGAIRGRIPLNFQR